MLETVGFTGTRRVLSYHERARVSDIVWALPMTTRVVTGACLGVDAWVARVAHSRGMHVHTIVPADRSRVDPEWRLYCTTFKEMPAGSTFRDRNVEIVGELTGDDRLIAVADHDEHEPESRRSGTWQTFRLAQKAGRRTRAYALCPRCDPESRHPAQGEAPE